MRVGTDAHIEFWAVNPISKVEEPKLGSDRIRPLDGRLSIDRARALAETEKPSWSTGYRIVKGIRDPREVSGYRRFRDV
jgi:hypothetical protein